MRFLFQSRFAVLVAANVLCWLAFSFSGRLAAEPNDPKSPFISSTSQRKEMIEELRLIKTELKTQNALLQSGQLRVVVAPAR